MQAAISVAEAMAPATLREAQRRPDWPKWEEAIRTEIAHLTGNEVWDAVDAPENVNVVGCRWVFALKKDAAGRIERYKARLVAQGYSQVYGVDFSETFAPVAKLPTLRLISALVAEHGWLFSQMDVTTAFLNSKLTDTIYMHQPPGYPQGRPGQVLLLRRAIYGLRQSGREWYKHLRDILESLGFTRCPVDHGLFIRRHSITDPSLIAVYVDDLGLTNPNAALESEIKGELTRRIKMTDGGEVHWLLGIEITRCRTLKTISWSQRSYILAILDRFNMSDVTPLSMPLDPSISLTAADSPKTPEEVAEMSRVPYREAVGSLMYLSIATRPDISYVCALVSRFCESPGRAHWLAVKRIFRYLKGTMATIQICIPFQSQASTLDPYIKAILKATGWHPMKALSTRRVSMMLLSKDRNLHS